jgi:hypothetical protein
VRLESFDAGAKPKVIKEVKALVPNLTLIEVRHPLKFYFILFFFILPFLFAEYVLLCLGEKVCRVFAKGSQREYSQGRRGEDQKGLRGAWRRRHPRVDNPCTTFPSPSSLWEQCSYIDFTVHYALCSPQSTTKCTLMLLIIV